MMDARTVAVVGLLLGMCISTGGSPTEVPHGYCRIVWLIGLPCDRINAALLAQIRILRTYQLVAASPGHLDVKHTSYGGEIQTVNFSMRPAFMGQGCHMEGTSVSLSWDKNADNANDYCNLDSLIQRGGLAKAPGFLEFANEGLCPGYKQSVCV